MNETKKLLLKQALQHNGYLEKKGSGALGSWQKRFFFMLQTDNGYSLLYSEKDTDNVPKGEIDLDLVLDIQYKKGKKVFNIIHSGRNFELRADNSDLASKWVEQIGIVKTILMEGYHLNSKKMERVQSMQINSTIGEVKKNEWKKVQSNTLKQIQEIGQFRQSVQSVAQNGLVNEEDYTQDLQNRKISEISQDDDNPEEIYEQKLKVDQQNQKLKNEIEKLKEEGQTMYSNWKEKVDLCTIKEKKIKEQVQEIEQLKQKYQVLEDENSNLKNKNQDLLTKIEEINQQNQKNEQKIEELHQKNQEQKDKIKELVLKNKNLFEQLNEKDNEIQELQNQQSIAQGAVIKNNDNTMENMELQTEINNLNEKIEFYKQEIQKFQKLAQNTEEKDQQIKQLEIDLQYANEQAVEAKVLNANLAWEKDQFQSQSINFKRKSEQLQNQLQQYQNNQ